MKDRKLCAKKIRALRDKKNWTQQDLADYSGIKLQVVKRLESPKEVHPKVHTMGRLLEVFAVQFKHVTVEIRKPRKKVNK